jgi:hypothetical protein
VLLDLSLSGGFTAAQRQTLQDYLVKDWKKMSAGDRKELVADLKRWSEAAPGSAAKVNDAIGTLRPKLLAQLQTARDDQRSRWLLELAIQERKKFELLMDIERKKHATMMFMAGNIAPSGDWRFNAASGKLEWLPK